MSDGTGPLHGTGTPPGMRRKRRETPIPTQREALRYFARLLLLIRPYWKSLAQGLGLGIVVGVVGMIAPWVAKMFVDDVYPTHNLTLMHLLVIGTVVLSFSISLMGALRGYFTQVLTTQLDRTVGLMYFNHVQHLPVRFFDERRVGEIMSRSGDVRGALTSVSAVIGTVFVNGVYVVLAPPVLLALNWRLAVLAMASLPITTAINLASGQVVRRYAKRGLEINADYNAFQMEILSHVRTVKTMGAEHFVYRRAADQLKDGMIAQLRSGRLSTLVGLGNGLIRMIANGVYTWFAWTQILGGAMTLGEFFAFTAYLGYLTGPVNSFAGLFVGFQQTAVTLGRAFEYLDEEPEQDPAQGFHPPPPIKRRIVGEIAFRDVSFGYTPERRVLHDVTLSIPRGTTSIVGTSGAGKSSLLRLVCRADEPTIGTMLIDGVAAEVYSLPDVRRQIGVVWQEFSLMRGTVWDNLTFALEEVDRDRVEEVVRVCRMDDFVRQLPEEYDTPVAEWGATLSGGQRQRLAIARALIRDTPVLLLDEATSQIDVQTEAEILRDLFALRAERTTVFVTHRVAVATLADQICVLDAGRVEAVGPHRLLLTESELYRKMLHAGGIIEEPRRLRVVPVEP